MTSNAPCSRWTIYLVFFLVYQTARLIEGYPRASSEIPEISNSSTKVDAGSSSDTPSLISRMIEEAYEQQVFLRPEQWQTDDGGDCCSQETQQTQWNTTKESSSDEIQSRPKKSLQDSSTDDSIYRSLDISTHRSTHRNSDEKIIFPDGRISSQTSVLPTSSCRKSTFCENVVDYPRQLVNAAIKRNASLRYLESVDSVSDIEQRIDVPDIEQRMDESTLCRIRERVVYPQTAQNKEKQWLFIVNQDDLKQGIRIEVCLNDGQECNLIGGFAEGYRTSCKQKYIYRELAAVGSDGNIFKDQFRFPSSCCCHVSFVGNPTARLGGLDLLVNRTRYK